MKIAAISDIHYGRETDVSFRDLFRYIADNADVLLLCGDLTDHGREQEAEALAGDLLHDMSIPILGVLGNHDFEAGTPERVVSIMAEAGVRMLDGDAIELDGVGFAGVAGYFGGFGRWALGPWGETLTKQLVQATVDEELKLEKALQRLQVDRRVVLMHYAPIRDTVMGEPEEIMPFLGSSRLEAPLNQYDVSMAFHGHAHLGASEGRTTQDVPVYNVSIPVLRRDFPDRPPVRILDLKVKEAVGE
jgi:Icc-related predicted phosphoesterase